MHKLHSTLECAICVQSVKNGISLHPCQGVPCQTTAGSELQISNAGSLTVPAGQLAPGNFMFDLSVGGTAGEILYE